jgi:hypothetical protein
LRDRQCEILLTPLFTQNVRGVDFDIGILDEVWFCHDSIILDGFVPVAMKRRSCLVMATTPGKSTALFARLISLKDEKGKPKMRLIRSGQPCDSCMQKSSTPWTCIHTLDEKPPWKSAEKEERMRWLYNGQMKKFMEEQLGVTTEDSARPIQTVHLAQFRNRALYQDVTNPDVIYLAADPASNGACKFALTACYFAAPTILVVCPCGFFFSSAIVSQESQGSV